VGPILQGLSAYTGLHTTLLVGGPMPDSYYAVLFFFFLERMCANLNSFSYGRNNTAMAHHWAQWDKSRFANVQEFFVDYLKTAYSASHFRNV
jgi:hypothetical protein